MKQKGERVRGKEREGGGTTGQEWGDRARALKGAGGTPLLADLNGAGLSSRQGGGSTATTAAPCPLAPPPPCDRPAMAAE